MKERKKPFSDREGFAKYLHDDWKRGKKAAGRKKATYTYFGLPAPFSLGTSR
jgi:hypothetical protein